MASLKDIFSIEEERHEPDTWNKIHLFKIGDFWRAYEWSAWLIAVFCYTEEVRMATENRHVLQVSRLPRTDVDDTYCQVGFPVRSLEKFVPTRDNFESVDNKHVIVTITLPQLSDGDNTVEVMTEAFRRWKESIAMKQQKEKKERPAADAGSDMPSGGILSQIMAYPISERTAIENIQFIQSLKQQLATIL